MNDFLVLLSGVFLMAALYKNTSESYTDLFYVLSLLTFIAAVVL
jgi:multisubunit Na+/H+ antiporter MnhF subunit